MHSRSQGVYDCLYCIFLDRQLLRNQGDARSHLRCQWAYAFGQGDILVLCQRLQKFGHRLIGGLTCHKPLACERCHNTFCLTSLHPPSYVRHMQHRLASSHSDIE